MPVTFISMYVYTEWKIYYTPQDGKQEKPRNLSRLISSSTLYN